MSEEELKVQRALSVLVEALKKAEIREINEPADPVALFSGRSVFWVRTDDDIELSISHRRWSGGTLQASISLKDIAKIAIDTGPKENPEAVEALVAVLAYLEHIITTLLSRVHHDLLARHFNMFPKLFPNVLNDDKKIMDKIQGILLKPTDSGFEKKDKQLRNEIRAKGKRGGNKRTKQEWRSESARKQFATKVIERKPLASCIKEMFDRCEGEAGWIEDLRQDKSFQFFSSDVPDEIISWAVRRVASEDVPAREREPLSVACEMARRELALPEQNIETLRDYYGDGEKLLKKERNQKSQ